MTERAPGFYWVKDRWDDEWWPAQWKGDDGWTFCGHSGEHCDDDYWVEIGEPAERTPNVELLSKMLLEAARVIEAAKPQPITDAQKNGERFLVWATPVSVTERDPGSDPTKESGWLTAWWDDEEWIVGGDSIEDGFCLPARRVTHYLPVPLAP